MLSQCTQMQAQMLQKHAVYCFASIETSSPLTVTLIRYVYHLCIELWCLNLCKINLIVGIYFKTAGTWYIRYSKLADEVITWIHSKTLMHCHLKQKHVALNSGQGLSVFHAVITCWTAHYLSYTQIYYVRFPLEALIELDLTLPEKEHYVIFGDEKA